MRITHYIRHNSIVNTVIASIMTAGCAMAFEIDAADYGVEPGGKDCSEAMQKLIELVQGKKKSGAINFEPGEYHFHAATANPCRCIFPITTSSRYTL